MGKRLDPRVDIRAGGKPGDLGWVISRHGALYAAEFGWNQEFEVLVAGIATDFFLSHDLVREHCWFAEFEGRTVGSVFLVKSTETIAKLRMLIVEPDARGLGIGAALVEICIEYAIAAGYERMTLWTDSVLVAARRLYQSIGFELVESSSYHSFGHDLISETWEVELSKAKI